MEVWLALIIFFILDNLLTTIVKFRVLFVDIIEV